MFVDVTAVVERLNIGQRFLVIGHIRPDGDAVSSVAALVMILRKMGKTAEGCIVDPLPDFFARLSDDGAIKGVSELRDYTYDTSITVDSSDIARIGDAVELLENGVPDITLDHHKSNLGFGKINFCDSAYAATAMIVYEIGKQLVEFDSALAETLLLGIATDTGFFRYASADERVFAYAAELVRTGANIGRITQAILEHRTLNEIHLHTAMFKTLKILSEGRLATAYVTTEMMKETGCTDEDTAGLVGQLRAIGDVEVAIMFIESSTGEIHVSLRSKNIVDVSEIALKFGGGGHARAAGCSATGGTLEQLMGDVVAEAEAAISTTFAD